MRLRRKNNPQVDKVEQSLKLREREHAIEQIEGKTMRSDTKKSIRNILWNGQK